MFTHSRPRASACPVCENLEDGSDGRPYLPDHPRQASSGRPHPVTPPADDVHEPTFVAWSGCLRQTGGTTSPARWRPHTSASHVRPSRKPMDVLRTGAASRGPPTTFTGTDQWGPFYADRPYKGAGRLPPTWRNLGVAGRSLATSPRPLFNGLQKAFSSRQVPPRPTWSRHGTQDDVCNTTVSRHMPSSAARDLLMTSREADNLHHTNFPHPTRKPSPHIARGRIDYHGLPRSTSLLNERSAEATVAGIVNRMRRLTDTLGKSPSSLHSVKQFKSCNRICWFCPKFE
ncbi:hypothetical protein GWK47_000561 [Chionoecetes opilio]|uniref:Uncharacterized protein n=1 Tax=Chionoecetes opilio TaxID=41210 RepID=A0A8J5CVK2_CHIOP|nr:hypothetical protein GWK47_000561 [Chionoecetes opilio]